MSLSAAQQVSKVRPLALREVKRQVIAPRRVIMARLMLYVVTKLADVDRPWVSAHYALEALSAAGTVEQDRLAGTAWYYHHRVDTGALQKAKEEKVPVYQAWLQAGDAGARHCEHLWRRAFAQKRWLVEGSRKRVVCPIPTDPDAPHKDEHELDVSAEYRYTDPPLAVGCEVKNGWSEGWINPDIVRGWEVTTHLKATRHHFKAMAYMRVTPVLVAPYVDRSFYVFQSKHGGLHSRSLWHVFAPRDAKVAQQVRATFRLGHVWAEPEPPKNFLAFVERIPTLLAPRKG